MDLCRPWNSLPQFFTAGPKSKSCFARNDCSSIRRPNLRAKKPRAKLVVSMLRPAKETSDFGEFPPFERRRDRAAHQQFRQPLGRLIQLVNALADELVVAASHRLFERRHACVN